MPEFRCTYRIQLNADFTFSDLAGIADYLKQLGVSHAYLSPILATAPYSTHGYDVADPTRINETLGAEEGYLAAAAVLRAEGIGQVLDMVPNHLSIETPANQWWWNVLENGPHSPYYHYFDSGIPGEHVRFEPLRIAVLEGRYGEVLRAGKIRLERTKSDLRVVYGTSAFPLAPSSYAPLLGMISELTSNRELAALASAFSDSEAGRQELWRGLTGYVAVPANANSFDRGLAAVARDVRCIHDVLNRQYYRLAYWRTASESWHYRRFFDINTLAGLRVEQRDVFTARHMVEFSLVRRGLVDGLRIDHVDGLLDPLAYLQLVHEQFPETPVWVEKILGSDETLPLNWPVAGTTGYDFLNVVNGIFVNPESESALTNLYQEFSGERERFAHYLNEAKREVLRQLFGGELSSLADVFAEICELHPDARDSSRFELVDAILEYVVALPVYRTYVDSGELPPSQGDLAMIEQTVKAITERRPDIQPAIFDFLGNILLQKIEGELETEFVLRLQQLTGPAMAKGAEDTAFYRYNRLLSLNEVGGDPAKFGNSIEEFHDYCARVSREWPMTLLATSTHDTKRGEDARLRLNALTELSEEWRTVVENSAQQFSESLISGNVQYHFYQAMVSAWPVDVSRATEFMRKVVREAKRETSWSEPNAEYEAALERFVETALNDEDFTRRIEAFVSRLDALALPSSLSQTLIKLTAPGVPDIYRGCEVLSYSLVDPDNRRPVDFSVLRDHLQHAGTVSLAEAFSNGKGDIAKLSVVKSCLEVRARHEECFAPGASYEPLKAEGAAAERVVSYTRGPDVCAIALRWFGCPAAELAETLVTLPPGKWRNIYNAVEVTERASLADLMAGLPVALLERLEATS